MKMEEDTWSILNLDLEQGDPYLELERRQEKQPIFKIPTSLKERNVKAYEPQIVSIGPYHYGKPHLMPMEVHKQRALLHFVKRSGVPIQVYMSELMKVVHQLKGSYEQLDEEWLQGDTRFIQLMILDGCFIIEFMGVQRKNWINDYARDDPIFSSRGFRANSSSLVKDFVLVENQVPYLVTSTLLSIAGYTDHLKNVHGIASSTMLSVIKGPAMPAFEIYMSNMRKESYFESPSFLKYSASELYYFGIQFKKIGSFGSIEFHENNAILNLPSITFRDNTLHEYLNMLAYELRVGTNHEFNSYICLIVRLVQSVKDVRVLKSQKILINTLGSDEAVVEMLKRLENDLVIDSRCKSITVLKQMNDYCERSTIKRRRKFRDWKSNLNENYFRNPWTSISVGAAAFLLVLTVIQTIYTIRSFYSSKN
ncbi:Protein of unknown function DUF247 [Macleaya cordata]|uniref:Uncharacterized protein n=1 Tax=Macleaya cordata TaxID=56857 RepID=A0A200PXN3_MACCD|nr:Protein of unknown function DUF247 [Macleaya cordata]